eukprot:CAMPEP_0198124198 /NCGR_PEP_ID=MMETSP1442-20131203/39401_1 /TAXON_ID= /ORGANISM="Craspedostauros australis, Strain CCMP3328" /LENGTH=155 /DNA_ID=CAMNT_0043783555 /DNA_START=354 /DNA_END=821 /DNA_ORIENTATION=-
MTIPLEMALVYAKHHKRLNTECEMFLEARTIVPSLYRSLAPNPFARAYVAPDAKSGGRWIFVDLFGAEGRHIETCRFMPDRLGMAKLLLGGVAPKEQVALELAFHSESEKTRHIIQKWSLWQRLSTGTDAEPANNAAILDEAFGALLDANPDTFM